MPSSGGSLVTADDGVLLSSCEWRNGDIAPWANEAFCPGFAVTVA
jgi:hypothetical protein